MFVTRHNSVVERGLLERLWELYELAYRKTAEESASREMFYRSEFDAAIADSTNRLWVLWADDEPVAMVLIASARITVLNPKESMPWTRTSCRNSRDVICTSETWNVMPMTKEK